MESESESDDSILQFANIYNVYQRLAGSRPTNLITWTYNLLDAFKKITTPSTEPFYVYRCYQRLQDGWPIMLSSGEINPSIPIDTFLSTSILLRLCDFWCVPGPINFDNTTHQFRSEERMRGNIIICIKIPRGTRGIAIVNYSQIASQTNFDTDYSEFEYLLPPGGSLEYTGTSIQHVSKNRERYEVALQRNPSEDRVYNYVTGRYEDGLTSKTYPEETLPKTMTIHIYDYVGTNIVARTRVSRQQSNDTGAGIGYMPPAAALPPPPPPPPPQTISSLSDFDNEELSDFDNEENSPIFNIGDRVWVRHNVGEKWKRGTVKSIYPRTVLPDRWSKAFEWRYVVPLTESNTLAGPEVESNVLAPPAVAQNVVAPPAVAQNVLAPEHIQAIAYNINDRVKVKAITGNWWMSGTVSSTEPFKVMIDGRGGRVVPIY
jgi:hypothetical protein